MFCLLDAHAQRICLHKEVFLQTQKNKIQSSQNNVKSCMSLDGIVCECNLLIPYIINQDFNTAVQYIIDIFNVAHLNIFVIDII